eukprot:UN02004
MSTDNTTSAPAPILQKHHFDPKLPLPTYNKLGGLEPIKTPTEYNWLLTTLYRLYYYSPLRNVMRHVNSAISVVTTFFTQTIVPTTYGGIKSFLSLFYPTKIIAGLKKLRKLQQYYYNTWLKPAAYYIITTPQRIVSKYPYTTSLAFALALSSLVLFDLETDLRTTPFFPIYDKHTPLGQAIAIGRRIRRALGGRTFQQYVDDKLALGDQAPTKQFFTDHYGPFVDEVEWNLHNSYRDDVNYHLVAPPDEGISEEELREQITFIEMSRRYTLLDEQFRQRQIFQERRDQLSDYLYDEAQWDLRDGTIIPPGQAPDKNYKPYKIVPQNPNNPIPHNSFRGQALGQAKIGKDKRPIYPKRTTAKFQNEGEFDEELLHMPNVTSRRELRQRQERVDERILEERRDHYVNGRPPIDISGAGRHRL